MLKRNMAFTKTMVGFAPMSKSFRAQIEDFAGLTEKQMRAVVVDSVQDVLEGAQTSQPSVKVTGGSF